MNFCTPQPFIGVNVTDPGQHRLVENGSFYRGPCPPSQPLAENLWRKISRQRLWPNFFEEIDVRHFGRRQQAHPAKLALVIKIQLATVTERKRHARRLV